MFTFLAVLAYIGQSPLPYIANLIGISTPALHLLISILLSYPIALIYHKYVRKHKEYRQFFFIFVGLDMACFNFGTTFYHNVIVVIIMYLSTMLINPGKIHAFTTFALSMTYLVMGYIMTESEEYDITWTMPHCVLTLKLISLSFDLWDGQKIREGKISELSINNKKTAVVETPTLLELFAYIYFPASFLVGPMFSFKRYRDFVQDKFLLDENMQSCETQGFQRFIQGLLYLIAFQVGVTVFSVKVMLSDEFWEYNILYRHLFCGMWAHFALYKYISCWLLTEAACIRFGLAYNEHKKIDDQTSVVTWDGCNNIKLLQFEGATKFQHYIDSFNCNTNYFAAEYVYKRLKFLGNRNLSQLLTLAFLALWHGIRSGYYATFLNEFLIILMEKELESIVSKTEWYKKMWSLPYLQPLLYVFLKGYTIIFMGWSLIPFDLKVFSKWWPVYSSLWFSGYFIFLPWSFIYKPLLLKAIKTLKLE